MRLRTLLATAGALLCAVLPALTIAVSASAAPPAAAGPSPDDSPQRLFAWFDTLGYPDVTRLPLVKVRTNFFNTPGFRFEFLIADGDESFRTLRLTTLSESDYRKPPAGGAAADGITFEPCDLAEYLGTRIRESTERLAPDYAERFGFHEDVVRERAQLFVLARAAQARGLHAEVKKLFDLIARQPPPRWIDAAKSASPNPNSPNRNSPEPGSPNPNSPNPGAPRPASSRTRSLKQQLVDDLAFAETAGALHELQFPEATRKQFLARLERVVARFPEFARHAEVADAAARLRHMVREDEEHAARPHPAALESLPPDEQLAERLYRLRDLRQYHIDMTLRYYGPEFQPSTGPVRELANHGLAAVPRIIAALDDRGFMRVNPPPHFYSAEPYADDLLWPPSVGDVAANAICWIAGRTFEPPSDERPEPIVVDRAARNRRMQAWYDDVRRRGRKAVLVDGARSGEYYAAHQVYRLAETYPDDSADTIIEIAASATELKLRCEAVAALEKLKGDAIEPFLLKEAEFGPLFSSSVTAAHMLRKRGVDEWGPVLFRRWNNLTAAPVAEPPPQKLYEEGPHVLAKALLHSNNVEWVRAESARFHRLPIAERAKVVFHVRQMFLYVRTAREKKYEPTFIQGHYQLLLAALDDDREQADGMRLGTLHDKPLRIADIVGHVLYNFDGVKYPFEAEADRADRDRQLWAIRTTLRGDLDLPPLDRATPPTPRRPTFVTQN